MLSITGIDDIEHVPLYRLEKNQCKFPVHEDRKIIGHFLFCAASTAPGEVYCLTHQLKCLTPKEIAERRRRGHGHG